MSVGASRALTAEEIVKKFTGALISPETGTAALLLADIARALAARRPAPHGATFHEVDALTRERDALRAALIMARQNLMAWNDMGIPADLSAQHAADYEQSPEIKAIDAALDREVPGWREAP